MENVTEAPLLSPKGTFPATVAKVIDDYKLVINRGEANAIREGQRMMVYHISDEEILDPRTGESLGYLELVRGTGRIIFVQDKLSILESDRKPDIDLNRLAFLVDDYRHRTVTRQGIYPRRPILESERVPVQELKIMISELGEKLPFENPQVGDFVKPI